MNLSPKLYAQGTPEMKSFIPMLYAPRLLAKFYATAITPSLFNTDYEGMFDSMGQKVKIAKRAEIQVKGWKDGDPVTYPRVKSEDTDMEIEHGFIWSFSTSKLHKKQSRFKNYENEFIADANKQAQKYTELACLGKVLSSDLEPMNIGLHAGADSGAYNLGTLEAPVHITSGVTTAEAMNAIDYIADMNSVLDEQNLPDSDVFNMAIPKVFKNRLSKSQEFKDASIKGDSSTAVKIGRRAVGSVFDTNLFESSFMRPVLVRGKKVFPVFACSKRAVSFALQFTNHWNGELVLEVGNGYRGVGVFGCKVIEPKALAVGYVTFDK